jgi:hypothetical protein
MRPGVALIAVGVSRKGMYCITQGGQKRGEYKNGNQVISSLLLLQLLFCSGELGAVECRWVDLCLTDYGVLLVCRLGADHHTHSTYILLLLLRHFTVPRASEELGPKMRTYTHLTPEEQRHFVEHGWLRVPGAIQRKYVDEWMARLWVRLGWDPEDKSTWTEDYIKMPRHREVPVEVGCAEELRRLRNAAAVSILSHFRPTPSHSHQ